jgi:hypothetical protein
MAYNLRCPCGVSITAPDDTFVATVQAHLADEHPGMEYSEAEIMLFAMRVREPGSTGSN